MRLKRNSYRSVPNEFSLLAMFRHGNVLIDSALKSVLILQWFFFFLVTFSGNAFSGTPTNPTELIRSQKIQVITGAKITLVEV